MSSDKRWTGGVANREWNRGTAPLARADEVMSAAARQVLQTAVKRYLDECARFRTLLRAADHPTPRGMLHMVWCRDEAERDAALEEYAYLTGQ